MYMYVVVVLWRNFGNVDDIVVKIAHKDEIFHVYDLGMDCNHMYERHRRLEKEL